MGSPDWMLTTYAAVSTSAATPPPTVPVLQSAGLDPHDGVQAWHHWAQRAGPCSGMPGAETQEQVWKAAAGSHVQIPC